MKLTSTLIFLFGVVGFGLASVDEPADGSEDNGGVEAQTGDVKTCPPICTKLCPFGFEKDENGCPICRCKKTADETSGENGCSNNICFLGCPYGLAKDERGCELCQCYWPPTDPVTGCPVPSCSNECPEGYETNEQGCQTCDCAPIPARPPLE